MVLNRDCAVPKSGATKLVGTSFPKAIQVCFGECCCDILVDIFWTSEAFLLTIVDLTFHEQWHRFRVRCQPSCSDSFAWRGSHPSLATHKDATVEVVLATCHKCSSKLCLLFGPFGPTSLQQRQLRKNHNFGTATRVETMQCKTGEAAKL